MRCMRKLGDIFRGKKKLGTVVEDNNGKKTYLLNTHGKGIKFSRELKSNSRVTNSGRVKTDKNGNPKRLTKEQRAYRSGYLDCNRDHAKAYNAKKKK